MLIAVAVVDDGLFLDALLGDGAVDVDHAVRARRGGDDGDLQRVQASARIAVRGDGEMRERLVRDRDLQLAEAALLIRQRAPLQGRRDRRRERLELENLRARDERRVDVEEGIVRGRADQPHRAALDIGSSTSCCALFQR